MMNKLTNESFRALANTTDINSIGGQIKGYLFDNQDLLFSHKSGNTKTSYLNGGRKFLNFLEDREFTPTVVEDYAHYIKSLDIKKTTKAAYGTACRIMLERLSHFRNDLLPVDVMIKITKYADWEMERKRHLRDGITEEENSRIKSHIEQMEDSLQRIRFKAMHALFLLQGLRASECGSIKVECFDFASDKLTIIRKGGIQHEQHLFGDTKAAVKDLLIAYNINSGYLFKSISRNQKITNKHITRTSIGELWRERIFKPLGIENKSVNDFRHTLAARAYKETNGNTYDMMDILGHKTILTAQAYTDKIVRSEKLKKLDNKFSY